MAESSGSSDGEETASGGGDGAGVGDVELKRCAGGKRLGERHGGFVELAGVVGVGVEGGDREADVAAGDADALPVEGRGDLQRNARQRRVAGVADGDKCACGELLCVAVLRRTSRSRPVMVTAWRSASSTEWGVGGLRGGLGGGAGGADGVAVCVEGTLEDDLACWLGGLRGGLVELGP